jgi:hypothetical protein
MDVEVSAAFESIHSLRERVGRARRTDEHTYRSLIDGIPSLSSTPSEKPLRLVLRKTHDRGRRHTARSHRILQSWQG